MGNEETSYFDRMLKRKKVLESSLTKQEFVKGKKTLMLDDDEIEPSYTNGIEREYFLIPFYMPMGHIASVEWALWIEKGEVCFIWNAEDKRKVIYWWSWDWKIEIAKVSGLSDLLDKFKQQPSIELANTILEMVVKEIETKE